MVLKMLEKVTCSKHYKNLIIILLIQYTFISNFIEKAQRIFKI